ncbi:GTPase activating factor [Hypoxylon texense]
MTLAPAAPIKASREKASTSESVEKDQTTKGDSTSTITEPNEKGKEMEADSTKTDTKPKKRSLFGFGKKKADQKAAAKPQSSPSFPSGLPSPPIARDVSQASTKRSTTASPSQAGSPNMTPSSPGRGLYSSSPRLSSPAGSQIFERDVQESTVVIPNSPAIPSHIQTENYIPPVLDASSEAITDDRLNPDTVEIVTHNAHQPASVTVTGASPYDSVVNSWAEDLAAFSDKEEVNSNYGSLDSSDVRRLSFISFADVVQAEQVPPNSSRDSMHLAGLTSIGSRGVNRSPSPIRSPVSSQGPETSPPNSISGSIKGLSMSPVRKPLGSPTSAEHSLSVNGDLNIETMSQALRRTGSTDLSVARSLPVSPIEGPSR